MRFHLVSEISIHALREEGDSARVNVRCVYYIFLSTPSARRATGPFRWPFSTPGISIHALREEGDLLNSAILSAPFIISIHALREEGDDGDRLQAKNY